MTKIDSLDPDKIKAHLKTKRIGQKVLVYDSTSSTNDIASEYAKNIENDGLVVFAEEQIAGRGRTGNKWLTAKADSILCSVLLTESEIPAELLSLTCAVATAETIGKTGNDHAKIKWPNDIILNGKKVAGILLESTCNNGGVAFILGIGINCHQIKDAFTPELKQTATSIDIESGTTCDRTIVARRMLTSLEHWINTAQKNSKKVIKKWQKLSILLGQRITLICDGKKFTGVCTGIDPEKGIILQLERGGVKMFDAAHTTIVK